MTMRRSRIPFRTVLGAAAGRFGPPLGRLGVRLAAPKPVRLAMAVWARLLDEACDLVAPAFARIGGQARLVAVTRAAGGLDLFLVKGGAVTELTGSPAEATGRAPVELRLRADQMLERILVLPAASRDYLEAIIEHRLERLAPWRRETILHGFAVSAGDDGALSVTVLLTSTEIVAAPLAALRARGLVPARIGGEAERPSEPLRIVMGQGGMAARRPSWQRAFGRIWLTGSATLCLLAVGTMIMATMADSRRTDAERHLVKARRLIREAADAGSPDTLPLLADKRPDRATMVLIDTLAAALPDTSYLRELAVTPEDVRLVGTSADAPALIPLIEKAGFFNVRFSGPVARGDDRRDSFEITADRAARKDPQ